MPERANNKTIMCSVLFLDIPNYSRMSVSGQIELKERFNAYLSSVITRVPLADRIILDTGDGAAINFLGDVEDALKVALALDEYIRSADPEIEPRLSLRMGINLGPVRLTRDINGQPNIVGDGINVAQRIMAFADIGQILVSRSYHDAVSRLTPEYASMLHYLGTRTDKHVREHEIYALVSQGRAVPQRRLVGQQGILYAVLNFWNVLAENLDARVDRMVQKLQQASTMQRIAYAGMVMAPLIMILAVVWKYWLPLEGQTGPSTQSAETQARPADTSSSSDEKAESKWYNGILDSHHSGGAAYVVVQCAQGSEVFVDGSNKGKLERGTLKVEIAAGLEHTLIITNPEGGVHSQKIKLAAGQTRHLSPKSCK